MPDQGVDHQYVDPFRGSDLATGTSPGDATLTLTQAAANLTTPGVGVIELCSGRYDLDESSLDYTDFHHKAQMVVKGAGINGSLTQVNWVGGDGDRITGTVTATAGATALVSLGGSNSVLSKDLSQLVRIEGAGYGGKDLVTWVSARVDNTNWSIIDPILTSVTAAKWTIYRPIFLWMCGSRFDPTNGWSGGQGWGAQGGLQDIHFIVDGDVANPTGGTGHGRGPGGEMHRNNLVFIGIQNGQNGGWFNRVRCGDKIDDGSGSGVEMHYDGLMSIYAFSSDVAGKGAGGLGMNFLRDLWLMGSEYGILSAFSTNPVEISGSSNSGKYGRAQIYVARGGNTTASLSIPYWKSELRDRYFSNPYSYATDFGNPDDSAGGVPFFFDLANPRLMLTGKVWSVQQEAGQASRGSTIVPNIPAIRYQPTENAPLVEGRLYGSKFAKAFSAVNQGTTYDKNFPGGVGPRAVKIDTWP